MIRKWEFRDSIQLRKLIRGFLESQEALGSDILSSEENITYYLNLGYLQVEQGDPHLVYEEDGEVIGMLQLGETLSVLQRGHKSCEYFSIYVLPEHEHKFISIQLLREASSYILSKGYNRCFSTVYMGNRRMISNMVTNPAIWPTNIYFEWRLDADPQFQDEIKFIERKS